MNQPTVCAVMLTRDRPELAAKAVECFRRQTYENKRLLIMNSGAASIGFDDWAKLTAGGIMELHRPEVNGFTIGALRNVAIEATENLFLRRIPENVLMDQSPDWIPIIVHWDDDDWSHPNRIAEQVALLQASGADVVGYNEMLFWREPRAFGTALVTPLNGEAWLYTSPVPKPTLGTSLCYWRKTWERKPFNPALPNNKESTGEDWDFIQGLKCMAIPSFGNWSIGAFEEKRENPRMIARIHSSNTTKYNIEDARGDSWKRVPEWDNRFREILE